MQPGRHSRPRRCRHWADGSPEWPESGIVAVEHVGRVIRRAVVHDDDLVGADGLREATVQAFAKEAAVVEADDGHAHPGLRWKRGHLQGLDRNLARDESRQNLPTST